MQTEESVEYMNGCGGLHSPRHVANMVVLQENRSYSSSRSSAGNYTSSTNCYNANESRLLTPTKVVSTNGQGTSPSSFIMQRVERLYGPGALATGLIHARRTAESRKTSEGSKETKTPSSAQCSDKVEDSSLPVLKLLRPEFRAQLSVANRKSRLISPCVARSSHSPASSLEMRTQDKVQTNGVSTPKDTVDAAAKLKSLAISPEKEVKDGVYFLQLLEEQVKILEKLALATENELRTCESEEGCGILRAISGKARLLVSQKLAQFRGLCKNNLKQTSSDDFPTTNEDLAGFWDMVSIQVREVLADFEKLPTLRKNNWHTGHEGARKKVSTPIRNIRGANRRSPSSPSIKPSSARDEERKRILEEKRRAMKQSKPSSGDTIFIM